MSSMPNEIHRARLFVGSCLALVTTAVFFAFLGDIMGALKTQFVLTNQQVGAIGGAGLWGFAVSIMILGPLCDVIGMKRMMVFAFVCHVVGALSMIFARNLGAFTPADMLYYGALLYAIGNGTIEAACNPLVATIYPDRKTERLNQFHVWFPGGIMIGGLLCYALNKFGIDGWAWLKDAGIHVWQFKLGLVFIPALLYGSMIAGQKFPPTERVQLGISFGQMVSSTLFRPLYLILVVCIMMTASIELGTGRWIPAVYASGGLPGILMLVWINGLMSLMRQFAGPVVHKLSPTGILVSSTVAAGAGLWWLSYAESLPMAFGAGTLFAVGICYFWPTLLGVVSERVPKGGALAMSWMSGIGMLVVGLVTAPMMGEMADKQGHEFIVQKEANTPAVFQQVVQTFTPLEAHPPAGLNAKDIGAAVKAASDVLAVDKQTGVLPAIQTANALRAVTAAGVDSPVSAEAKKILDASDNYGGRMSFRMVSTLAIALFVIFGGIFLYDRKQGGYQVEKIG